MLLRALVFRFSSRLARLDLVAAAGGLPSLPAVAELRDVVGGRCETQSWTRRLTCGLERRFCVLSDWALVDMMIVGWEKWGEDGRKV